MNTILTRIKENSNAATGHDQTLIEKRKHINLHAKLIFIISSAPS